MPGAFSNARPALGRLGNNMVIAWKGMGDDQGIYWSKFDGNSWTPFQNIAGRGTSHAPALASAGDRLFMFWKGMGDEQRIFFSWLDAAADSIWQPGWQVAYPASQTSGMSLEAVFTDHHPTAVVRDQIIFLA
ncbi:MAG TPA: hypothetical protein VH640_12560 [Bryobacteraceae bacterium]